MISSISLQQRNNIILGITIVLGLFLLYELNTLFSAMLGAVVLYTIFRPLNLFFISKKKWRPSIAAIFVMLTSFFAIILPLSVLTLMVANKVGQFSDNPEQLNRLMYKLNKLAANYLNQPHLVKDLMARGKSASFDIFSTVISSTFESLLSLAIMYFVLYFMFSEHKKFERFMLRYAPFRPRNSFMLANELKNITYSNVLGQGLIALVQGSLMGLGFYLFKLQDPLFWGVIAIFLSFIPMLGTPLVFVPAGIIMLSNGDKFNGIAILLYGFILVSNIDNVLRFIIAKRMADTHPLISVIGVIIGIPTFGILGLVFGPLLMSFFILLIKIYIANREELIHGEPLKKATPTKVPTRKNISNE